MNPKVSVVIPTYNAPDLLLETLESVFSQTFTDYEVIVINDGSTDDTAERLQPLADAGRIRLIHQENAGIGVTRNRGLDAARGAYVALLDHDDLWMPTKLAVQVAFLDEHPECVACIVPWEWSDEPGRPVYEGSIRLTGARHIERPIRVFAAGVCLFNSAALMVRRPAVEGLRYEERRGCIDDIRFQVQMLARGPLGLAGDEILMSYRVHESNYSSRADYYYQGLKRLLVQVREDVFGIERADHREDARAFIATLAHGSVVRQIVVGQRVRGWELYLRSLPLLIRPPHHRFAAVFPVCSFLPRAWLARRWTVVSR